MPLADILDAFVKLNTLMILSFCSSDDVKLQELGKRASTVTSALPETAASVVIATTVVGAAATLLVQRSKAPKETEV